jgi:hypothetical protein
MFNALKPLSIVSERTAKIKDECGKRQMLGSYFELPGENCTEILTTGLIFLLNYEFSRF